MTKTRIALICLVLTFLGVGLWADDDWEITPRVHIWGLEADVAWRPISLLKDRQTTFWAGLEDLYSSWNYFHSPLTGKETPSSSTSEASNKVSKLAWFTGFSQGLVGHDGSNLDGRTWDSHDFLETFVYYKGSLISTLSSGSNLSDSQAADKSGWLSTSFMGGISLNRMSQADLHNLRSGFLLEGAYEIAPAAIQSVAVDYTRATFNLKGFFPLYDLAPDQRLNLFSILGGVNMVYDHLSGVNIPVTVRQSVGGRVSDGVMGALPGVGGAIRGVPEGLFDGKDKFISNLELRFNLPGAEVSDPFNLPLVPKTVYFIPGVVAFYDWGQWNDVSGLNPDSTSSAGVGLFLQARNWGTLVVYAQDWLANNGDYSGTGVSLTYNLGFQF